MLARVYSCAVIGLEGVIVEVEVDTMNGLPGTDIVGLPDKAVQESRSRVQSAVKNARLRYPRERIVVNLAVYCLTQLTTLCGFTLNIRPMAL
jgi:magnesium chelatase family protein